MITSNLMYEVISYKFKTTFFHKAYSIDFISIVFLLFF